MRARLLAVVMALCWGGCASLPQSKAALAGLEGKPYLMLTASPHVCLQTSCVVTLRAEIRGEIHWCPTSIRWQYGDGSYETPIGSCQERIFSQVRTYKTGEWTPSIQIFSDGTPVQDPLVTHVSVGPPSPPQ